MNQAIEVNCGPYFDDNSQDAEGLYDVQIFWLYEPSSHFIEAGSLEDNCIRMVLKSINCSNIAKLCKLSKNYFGLGFNLKLYKAVLAFCIRERDQMRNLAIFDEDAKGFDNMFNLESDLWEFGPIYPDNIRQKAVRHYLCNSRAALENAEYAKARVYAERARFLNFWATVWQFQEIDHCLSVIPSSAGEQQEEMWED